MCAKLAALPSPAVLWRHRYDMISGTAAKGTLCYEPHGRRLEPGAPKRVRPIRSSSAHQRARASARRNAWNQLKAQGESAPALGDDPNGPLGGLNSFYLLVDNPEVYGLPG